jgi:hypothetical protein
MTTKISELSQVTSLTDSLSWPVLADGATRRVTLSTVRDEFVKPATSSRLGGIKVGNNLSVTTDGTLNATYTYNLPFASDTRLGGVKVGTGLEVSPTGVLSATYSLPPASYGTLGGIKVGDNLTITEDGTLNAVTAQELDGATISTTEPNVLDISSSDTIFINALNYFEIYTGDQNAFTVSRVSLNDGRIELFTTGSIDIQPGNGQEVSVNGIRFAYEFNAETEEVVTPPSIIFTGIGAQTEPFMPDKPITINTSGNPIRIGHIGLQGDYEIPNLWSDGTNLNITTPLKITTILTRNISGYNIDNNDSILLNTEDGISVGPSDGPPFLTCSILDRNGQPNGQSKHTYIQDSLSVGSRFQIPWGQTEERDSFIGPQQGELFFNTSVGKFQGYTGSAWVDLH